MMIIIMILMMIIIIVRWEGSVVLLVVIFLILQVTNTFLDKGLYYNLILLSIGVRKQSCIVAHTKDNRL